MNGPEHYREAERLLTLADDARDSLLIEHQAYLVQRAHVHATLALTAAGAEPMDVEHSKAWMAVLG